MSELQKKVAFVFDFSKKALGFSLPEEAFTDDLWDDMQNLIDANKLERRFGVHDISGEGSRDGTAKILGYNSYEVTKKNIPVVMETWRNFFVEKFGEAAVGPVKEFPKNLFARGDTKAKVDFLNTAPTNEHFPETKKKVKRARTPQP
jgi:hypothetical protein